MPAWLVKILGAIYTRIPPSARPPLRRAFLWGLLRVEGLFKRRRISHGTRVEFLDFEIANLEAYEFLGASARDVLVRALASCVSPGTERAVLCGLPGARRPFPYTPGYSTVGTVVEAGKRSGFREGDRVAGRMPHASHGVMVPASMFRVPDGVTDEDASFIELGIICLQGVRKAVIRPGERVAVVGQGLIGQLAARLARLAGAEPIVAVAASRRRMATARRGGADSFVALSDDPGAIDAIQADVVIEAVGSAPAIALAMRASRPGGRVVLLGSSRDLGRGLDWWSMAQERDLTVIGAHIGAMPQYDHSATLWTYAQEGRLFLDLLARRELTMADLITWRARPDECNRVYEVLAGGGGEHVGIVFDWSGARVSA
jgi:2-desacetyl-2-hydroxyethyl bacteriochlorophyllide A dehydrogenase